MLKHLSKQMLSLLCAGVCVCAVSAPVMAAELPAFPEEEQFELRMTNISVAQCNLSVSNGKAVATADVTGRANTSKCKVVLKLQVKNGSSWSTVDSVTVEENDRTASAESSVKTESGKTYRAQATVTAWLDGVAETKTMTSASKTAR